MNVTLEPILKAFGYESKAQQLAVISLLQAAGAFGQLPGVDGLLSDWQCEVILKNVTFDSPQAAATWLHGATQEFMLRPHGLERHECIEQESFKTQRAGLLSTLHAAGLLSEIAPKSTHYDHVLVLGAMEATANKRIGLVKDTWDRGVRFNALYLLGSERALDRRYEPIAAVAVDGKSLTTEMEMMAAHYREQKTNWPQELSSVPAFQVDVLRHADGTRANTQDTVKAWLATNPKPGRVLVISSQPHVAYQDAVVKSLLPASFEVETIGACASEEKLNINVAMDALARQIHVGFVRAMGTLKTQLPEPERSIVMLDPSAIHVDADAYQFRSHGDKNGITQSHRFSAEKWDPVLHGDPLLVHERLDGTLFVADGHHRLDLARRLHRDNIAAIVLREADGYSVPDVKIIAAYKNLAQGRTETLDVARVFKEAMSGRVHRELLPELDMNRSNLKQALMLSTALSSGALDCAIAHNIPEKIVMETARQVPDQALQEPVLGHVAALLHSRNAQGRRGR